MPYKIVLTKEKGRSVLTSVPESWENDGLLSWPPQNANEKLKRQDSPEDNWDTLRCTVKRRNILTFHDAEEEVNRMCEYSDTECIDTADEMPEKRKIKKRKIVSHDKPDFNDQAETCMKNLLENVQSTSSSTISKVPSASVSENSDVLQIRTASQTELPIITETTHDVTNEIETNTDFSDFTNLNNQLFIMSEPQNPAITPDSILVILQSVMENQRILNDNQEKMTSEFVKLNVRFEEFVKSFLSREHSTKDDKINFVAITKIDDLEELESKLNDKNYRAKLDKTFSVLCKSNGKGLNTAYKLVDYIFHRDFMKECSWAGGSRSNGKKICFKAFKRTIDWFFNIVKATDDSFTMEDCETFLKNILRNSKKRSQITDMRQSAIKNRPKNVKKKTFNSNSNNDPGKNNEDVAILQPMNNSDNEDNVGLETSV